MNFVQHLASRIDSRRVAALRTRALDRSQARHWEDAERAWRRVMSATPNSIENAVELADVLRRLKRYDEADRLVENFLRSSPRDLRLLVVYARNATAAVDREAACERWLAVLGVDANSFEAHLRLAITFEAMAVESKASLHFDRARQLSPDHPELIKSLAAHLARKGDAHEAAKVYARVVERFPKDAEQLLSYARVLIDLGDVKAADGVLGRSAAGRKLDRRLLEARIRCDIALGAWAEVVQNLRRLPAKSKQSRETALRIWDLLRGIDSLSAIPPDVASDIATVIGPHQFLLIAAARDDHSYGFALELLSLFSESGRSEILRAELLADMRRYPEAEGVCRKLLSSPSKSNQKQILQLLDRIVAAQFNWAEALSVRRQVAALAPNDGAAHRAIAEAQEKLGDLAGAESSLLRAIQLNVQDGEALHRLGLLAFARNEPRLAQSYFGHATGSIAARTDAFYQLGITQQALDDRRASIDAYAACLKSQPTHKQAFNALVEIEGRDNEDSFWHRHLGQVEARSRKTDEEWVFLASARIFLHHFESALRTLEQALAVTGYHAELGLLLAHASRLDGRLEQAEGAIRRLLKKAPFYYRAYDELVQILCAGGRFGEAKDFVDSQPLYFNSPELKSRAIGLLTHVHFGVGDPRSALLTYRDSPLSAAVRQNVGADRFVQSLSVIRPDNKVLALAAWGLGDETLWSTFYPTLNERIANLSITCDPRMAKLLQRSFPGLDFRPTARWMGLESLHGTGVAKKYAGLPNLSLTKVVDNVGWDTIGRAEKVAVVTDLLPDVFDSLDSIPRTVGYLKPDPYRVDCWREKLAQRADGPKVGIAWSSLRRTHHRRGHLTNLADWTPVLKIPGLSLICLDPAADDAEIAAVRERFGVDIHRPEGLNLRRDIDDKAALMKALDLVICVANGVSELSGAIGVETWMLNRS
ncbi:tetratricopeptide repeat protein, partial [Reyranella sp.]|uniref:tetratricopeptide repeat protein n=1 Tax=Reyranella sp. TaxID=1929291 RepID=UPI003F710893